jgi:hypothetical protein
MHINSLIRNYLVFCEKYGFNTSKCNSSLRLCVLLSLKNVNHRSIFEGIGDDAFVEWNDHEGAYHNVFGNAAGVWVQVLNTVDKNVFTNSVEDISQVPTLLRRFNTRLQASQLTCHFGDVAKLFILCNINEISTPAALTAFFKDNLGSAAIQNFIVKQADERGDASEYEEALLYILKRFQILPTFETSVVDFLKSRATLQEAFQMKQTDNFRGRPRLRERLSHQSREMVAAHSVDPKIISQAAQDSFNGWSARVRFPNTVNVALRQKMYFLACQKEDYSAYIHTKLDADLAKQVCETPVSLPEVDVIKAVISRLNFYQHPFPELQTFRTAVNRGFPVLEQKNLTYPRVAQMYLAAYQREDHWQEIWLHVQNILNYSITKSVKDFVSLNKCNTTAITQLLDDN